MNLLRNQSLWTLAEAFLTICGGVHIHRGFFPPIRNAKMCKKCFLNIKSEYKNDFFFNPSCYYRNKFHFKKVENYGILFLLDKNKINITNCYFLSLNYNYFSRSSEFISQNSGFFSQNCEINSTVSYKVQF